MAKKKVAVGINPQSQIHYIDHLAVVCIFMDIPLLFIDPLDYEIGLKYYPGLNAQYLDYQILTPEYLISNYDVLFMSDLWDRAVFHQKFAPFEKEYGKFLRHVHCPHGFSDKGFYLKKCAREDISLLYGQNMIDQLKTYEVIDELKTYVITGNYRYTYFKQHKKFFDDVVSRDVLSRFAKPQPLILYAPTWMDVEESTTFFDAFEAILDNLPDSYNMIIKLHPRLELDNPGQYYHIVGRYESKPNVVFLKDFPLVYPLLSHADIYLGDMSSIGYDFLTFNKPMFFLNKQRRDPKTDRGLYLFRCGVEVKPDAYPLLYKFIEVNLEGDQEKFGAIRKQVYDYTFGKERAFKDLKKDIIKAYNGPITW